MSIRNRTISMNKYIFFYAIFMLGGFVGGFFLGAFLGLELWIIGTVFFAIGLSYVTGRLFGVDQERMPLAKEKHHFSAISLALQLSFVSIFFLLAGGLILSGFYSILQSALQGEGVILAVAVTALSLALLYFSTYFSFHWGARSKVPSIKRQAKAFD